MDSDQIWRYPFAIVGLAASLILSAGCEAKAPGNTPKVRVESITTDATLVQALAPPTAGKSAPGTVSGLIGYVPGSNPKRLIVFCHGLGHSVEEAWAQALADFTDANTVVVATNYRDNEKLPVLRGAHDTIAATLAAKSRFPSVQQVFLLGVSLGGAVSGTAITESSYVTLTGRSLYDYWVDVEGLSNLSEAWLQATALKPELAADIEDEAGGTPLFFLNEYVRRSPALRGVEMALAGLKAAVVVHDLNDGLVTYDHGRQMATTLLLAGIPVQVFEVVRVADGQDPGTTAAGALADLLGIDDPNNLLNLSGHGSEADYAHPVIRTGFEQLRKMLDGSYNFQLLYAEHIVDDGG